MRPQSLDDYVGQAHLVGGGGVFRRFLETGNVPSFILWGPPGVGKTTLARLVATALDRKFFTLSAVNSGVKEVREVIEQARKSHFFNTPAPFLFIDEIHRFNKSQQDSLLGAVEQGVITLIGATTENPSFEVISPLLSRCQVYVLKAMEDSDLQRLLDRAVAADTVLRERGVRVEQTGALFRFSGGDARKLLNIIDILCNATEGEIVIDGHSVKDEPVAAKQVTAFLPDNPDLYEFLTGIKYLAFIADIYGISKDVREERIRKYADAFELTGALGSPIGGYSHGMKQKLAVISELIRAPRLLILDEPFVGLDPQAAFVLKGFLREICAAGGAVFFSTHVLEVAEKLCDRIAIIKGGRLVKMGTTASVVGDESLEQVFLELAQEGGAHA